MEATRKRVLMPGNEYNRYFPVNRLQKTDPIIVNAGNVFDTILEMERIVKTTLVDTKELAPLLLGRNNEETCRKIFDFVYGHIQYTLDKAGVEQLRRPARAWDDRKAGIDCDCYSIFISSILTNLGIVHYFRMTKYNGKPDYQHIYIVVPKKPGASLSTKSNYYTIDCVLESFNEEVPYSQKHDKKMMPIQYLNGVENSAKKPGFGAEFIGLGGISGLGATQTLPEIGHDLLNRIKLHLENTRDILKPNPAIMPDGKTYLSQIEFVLKSWNDPQARANALEIVSSDGLNGLSGLLKDVWKGVKEGVSNATDWVGDKVSGAANAVATGVSNAANWAGNAASNAAQWAQTAASNTWDGVKNAAAWAADAAVEIGKFIVKYNPLSVAIRNGLLLAFKINFLRMAERLGYGYWDENTAKAKGLNLDEYRKLKSKLDLVMKIHSGLQGDLNILKKNILEGWEHGTKKHNLLRGLGAEPASTTAIASAMTVITGILTFLATIDWNKLFGKPAGDPSGDYSQSNKVPEGFDFSQLKDPGAGENTSTGGSSSMIIMGGGVALLAIALMSGGNKEAK